MRIPLVAAFGLLFPSLSLAQEAAKRPEWDQKKAVEQVKKVIDLEKTQGQPWDKVAWMTDVEAAVARAKKEDKPIFLYFYVKKGGPSEAPC
jgi:hypothetical protein